MSNTPKISVIVPVYNVEKYLNRCIDSILAQTFTDWELLLVDDGSTDRSGEICDEYAEKDSRIRVFHKGNGGVSSARNLGLNYARGEFIWFIDSDDWIRHDAMEILLQDVIKRHADIYFFSFNYVSQDTTHAPYSFDSLCDNSLTKSFCGEKECAYVIPKIEMCGGLGWTWNKIFKRSIIEKNHVRFDTKYSIQEDHLFTLSYLVYVNSISISRYAPYYYVATVGSLTSKCQTYQNTKDRNLAMYKKRYELYKILMINDKEYLGWFTSDYATRMVSNLTHLKESNLSLDTCIQEIEDVNLYLSKHTIKLKGMALLYKYVKWIPARLLIKLL